MRVLGVAISSMGMESGYVWMSLCAIRVYLYGGCAMNAGVSIRGGSGIGAIMYEEVEALAPTSVSEQSKSR